GNTRVINQKELEYFRQELQARLTNNYSVLLKSKHLPLLLLQDHQKVNTYVYFYHPDH
uniref:Nucleolar GTP-binding protein 2 N-terminal domain-containing protein n=1 Tax=Aegilops tauschii subsp. strangulata TaxID=200361 RepID=A0A453NN56_AEGTS